MSAGEADRPRSDKEFATADVSFGSFCDIGLDDLNDREAKAVNVRAGIQHFHCG